MATPTAPKRPRLGSPTFSSSGCVRKVILEARSTPFPWASAVPPRIAEWFESYAKSCNTLPEFVFTAAITTVAALMGPKVYVQLRTQYSEPVNLFTVIMAEPGAGKSQAFRLAVVDPLQSMDNPMDSMLVDDFTRKGLFRHLQRSCGRGLLAYEELTQFFDIVQKRQLEGTGERQIFCRLYDSGRWKFSIGTQGKEGCKEVVDEACVCICGFLQPHPFVQRILPALLESNDGFSDRILLCSPTPHLLQESEVVEWCTKHQAKSLQTLTPVYNIIAAAHQNLTSPLYYKYDEGGKQVWFLFSDEMTAIMNSQWTTGESTHGNMSKDKRTMIRLSGILHVLYHVMEELLKDESEDPLASSDDEGTSQRTLRDDPEEGDGDEPATNITIPNLISERVAVMARNLTEYFQCQRMAYEMGVNEAATEQNENDERSYNIENAILMAMGPFCTPRSVIRNMTIKKRPKVDEVVQTMKNLQEKGVGVFKELNQRERVFYKPLPEDENKDKVCGMTGHEKWDKYVHNFKKVDTRYITDTQHDRLLLNSPHYDNMPEYGVSMRSQ